MLILDSNMIRFFVNIHNLYTQSIYTIYIHKEQNYCWYLADIQRSLIFYFINKGHK